MVAWVVKTFNGVSKMKSDITLKSRKGRPRINGHVMTAAERKQRQRQKIRTQRTNQPRWLRLRHDVWQLIQQRFLFANVEELGCALEALGVALIGTNIYQMRGYDNSLQFLRQFNSNEVVEPRAIMTFHELEPFQPCVEVLKDNPEVLERSIFDLICDITGESRKEDQK